MKGSREIEAAFAAARVLVVEDSPFMQELLVAMLRAIGVGDVLTASDGKRAFERIEDNEIDCAVVDWLMQPISGFDFLGTLRKSESERVQRMPVIMCTAYTDRERVFMMRDAGASEILAKPVSPAKLYDKLAAAMFAPRAFVSCPAYLGPDRRRRQVPIDFPNRRVAGLEDYALDAALV